MLDISKRKIVTTRKDHECYGCTEVINTGANAIYITAKQDEQHMRLHLHLECNKIIARRKIDLVRGCVSDYVLIGGRRWECRYCDSDLPPRDYDGDWVCSSCGAEWADAKIHVKDEADWCESSQFS